MYRIWHLANAWREQGFRVEIVRNLSELEEADLVVPQIDISVIPEEYRPLLKLSTPVVNRSVVDIRKSAFSQYLVSPDDDYDGPVIVKSDCNCGGGPERRALRGNPLHKRITQKVHASLRALGQITASRSLNHLAYVNGIKPINYPVYESKSQVPRAVFANPVLVVEKFLPEQEGDHYYLRSYAFFGNEGCAVRTRASCPVVKGAVGSDIEFVPVDAAIIAAREELGFDYGKFDYTIHNGEAILFDTNTTPTFGKAYPDAVRSKIVSQLSRGVSTWL